LNQENSRVLVPPRPNLGPEPWSEERVSSWPLLAAGLVLAALLAGAVWMLRRRRRRRRAAPSPQPVAYLDTPDAQLLSLAIQARETLATRFGPFLRARTTEEISSDAVVKEALGDDHFESLIRLLSTADLWKFASPPENGQTESLLEELPHWSVWQGTLPSRPAGKR
jgi:LPXTG-motif cell wall-anchored protein